MRGLAACCCGVLLCTGWEACADEWKWLWRMAAALCAAVLACAWRDK